METENENQLQTITQDGSVPKHRVLTSRTVYNLCTSLLLADTLRAQSRSKVNGAIQGNPPYSRKQLFELGQGYRCNLNFREGEGIIDAAKTPYYDLIMEVPTIADCQTDYGNPYQKTEWSRIISEEFHKMLINWDGFDYNIQLKQYEFVTHGIGSLYWQDDVDWRFKALKIGNILIPDRVKATLGDIPFVTIRHTYNIIELYGFIKDEQNARSNGWDVDAVKLAITYAMPDSIFAQSGGTVPAWERVEEVIRSEDFYWSYSTDSKIVDVFHFLVKEFDGSISHYIIPVRPNYTNVVDSRNETDFLFKKPNRFDDFTQVISPFFYDVGDGYWHSIKGLGTKIYNFIETFNRLRCQEFDCAMQSMARMWTAKDGNNLQKLQLVFMGPNAIVPAGLEAVKETNAIDIGEAMAVRRDMQNTLMANTGTYRQRTDQASGRPRTAYEVQVDMTDQAVLSKGAVNRYYTQWDKTLKETYRRATIKGLTNKDPGGKEALEFRKRCTDRGVPEEAINEVYCVKAVRALGLGSSTMRTSAADKILGMSQMFDEIGRTNAIRDAVAATPGVGQSMVDRYVKPLDFGDIYTEDNSIAALENNALKVGGEVRITPMQNHVIHCQEHLAAAAKSFQSLTAETPLEGKIAVLTLIGNLGPHIIAHINYIKNDPTRKQLVQQFGQAWAQLAKASDQLNQQVQEEVQKQQQNPQNQGMQHLLPKVMETINYRDMPPDVQRQAEAMIGLVPSQIPITQPIIDPVQAMKTAGTLHLKQLKTETDMNLKEIKAQQDMKLKDLQKANEIKNSNLTTDNKRNNPYPSKSDEPQK